jgi:hypothetical protein
MSVCRYPKAPILCIKYVKLGQGMAQVVERLPSIGQTLASFPSTERKERKKRKEKGREGMVG